MSHSPVVFAPAGTPLLQRTVGELVAERPGRSRVFQAFGIDFCCQGSRTLQEACERKGVAASALVERLESEGEEASALEANPATLPLDELCRYIVEKHHAFLRNELPRLHAMSARVAHVHGGHTPSLAEVFQVFQEIESELGSHMVKEEQILFPAICALSLDGKKTLPLDAPVACMVHEHDDVGAALSRLRELTHGFQPPADACNTYRALFAGLHDLEQDLHRHIHLENAVLFPAAQALQ